MIMVFGGIKRGRFLTIDMRARGTYFLKIPEIMADSIRSAGNSLGKRDPIFKNPSPKYANLFACENVRLS